MFLRLICGDAEGTNVSVLLDFEILLPFLFTLLRIVLFPESPFLFSILSSHRTDTLLTIK